MSVHWLLEQCNARMFSRWLGEVPSLRRCAVHLLMSVCTRHLVDTGLLFGFLPPKRRILIWKISQTL